jgi:hypothetical protein
MTDLAEHRRQAYEESLLTDSLLDALELRVAALEQIAAARGPGRVWLRVRLGRQLRRSVAHFPGGTFAERRTEAAGSDWAGRWVQP